MYAEAKGSLEENAAEREGKEVGELGRMGEHITGKQAPGRRTDLLH